MSSLPDFGTIESEVACDGEHFVVHCANASLRLNIYSALYGRTESGRVLCPYDGHDNDTNYKWGEADFTEKFKALCERRNKCRVKINAGLFGDRFPQKKHLYLTLVYTCGE